MCEYASSCLYIYVYMYACVIFLYAYVHVCSCIDVYLSVCVPAVLVDNLLLNFYLLKLKTFLGCLFSSLLAGNVLARDTCLISVLRHRLPPAHHSSSFCALSP